MCLLGEGIDNALGDAFAGIDDAGASAILYTEGNREYDVRVILPREQFRGSEDLESVALFPGAGGSAPIYLRDVANVRTTLGPTSILRENQNRIFRLTGDVNDGAATVGEVNDSIRHRLAGLALPEGYGLVYGGEEEAINESNRQLATVVFLAIFLVFFERRTPLRVFAAVLAVWFLAQSALTFSRGGSFNLVVALIVLLCASAAVLLIASGPLGFIPELQQIAVIVFAAIFIASGIGHLTATQAMTGYAQYKKVPFAKASVIISGLLMIVVLGRPIAWLMDQLTDGLSRVSGTFELDVD